MNTINKSNENSNEEIDKLKEAIEIMETKEEEKKEENPTENKNVETRIVYVPQPALSPIPQEQVCPNVYS